jgi:hypothetical protein
MSRLAARPVAQPVPVILDGRGLAGGAWARAEQDLRVDQRPQPDRDPGSLQQDLHAALDVLLRRAQQAGAVRPGITAGDLVVLFKAALASIQDASAAPPDPAMRERVFAVLADSLRARPPSSVSGVPAGEQPAAGRQDDGGIAADDAEPGPRRQGESGHRPGGPQ